jgi:hypothetical protein
MKPEPFERQLGPFVLVQRPPDLVVQQRSLNVGAGRTQALQRDARKDTLSLLFELDDLLVATLPPMLSEGITVGRMPDCELVVDDPSVSKHHAKLTWNEGEGVTLLEDLGSSNGTLLNGLEVRIEVVLRDGDEVTFGDARYCYLKTKTLHQKLTTGRFGK